MCTRPLKGFKYGVTKNGKDNYIIRSYSVDHLEIDSSGNITDCLSPVGFLHSRSVVRDYIEIPCGKCLECRLNYSKQWANRCLCESLQHDNNCFITLTYDDDNVPVIDSVDYRSGEIVKYKTLVKKDFQDFMKRLRKEIPYPIRYFACGEYGSNTKRPHYHAIIFGWYPDDDDIVPVGKNELGQVIYTSGLLSKVWKKGFNTVGDCTVESCSYVARYVTKKANVINDYILKQMLVEPEFIVMSRKPGIGLNWFDSNHVCYANFTYNNISTVDGPVKITPNRYFDSKLEQLDPDKYQELKRLISKFPF